MSESQQVCPTFTADDRINEEKISSPTIDQFKLDELASKEIKREKLRIWKNIGGICLSFSCLFTAYRVASGLQSSVNSAAGLGAASQATVYVGQILASMFLPAWMIKKFNLKWTMVISELCYSTFIAAQFYPTFGTFIPTSFSVGIGAASLWCAKSIYVTKAGIRYAELLGKHDEKDAEALITRFFGIFFMTFQLSGLGGNLLSSILLSREPTNVTISSEINEERLSICGANFCNEDLGNMTDSRGRPIIPPRSQIDMLFGILLGFSLLAAVCIIFLVDSPKRDPNYVEESNLKTLIATFRHVKNPYQILIIPLTLWGGISQAYIGAEFTAAFIACSWGVENIGYVMMVWGSVGALSSLGCGYLVKFVGRIPIFVFGSAINFSLILTMLFFWSPDPSHPEVFFIVAGFWATANSVWNTQLNAFYGVIFSDKKEEAFSNYRLWQSLGFAIGWAYSKFLCVDVKLYILMAVLVTGMSGYLTIEIKMRSKTRSNSITKET